MFVFCWFQRGSTRVFFKALTVCKLRAALLVSSQLVKLSTVNPVPLKIDKTKVLMTNSSLMKVKSIAECSSWGCGFFYSLWLWHYPTILACLVIVSLAFMQAKQQQNIGQRYVL